MGLTGGGRAAAAAHKPRLASIYAALIAVSAAEAVACCAAAEAAEAIGDAWTAGDAWVEAREEALASAYAAAQMVAFIDAARLASGLE